MSFRNPGHFLQLPGEADSDTPVASGAQDITAAAITLSDSRPMSPADRKVAEADDYSQLPSRAVKFGLTL